MTMRMVDAAAKASHVSNAMEVVPKENRRHSVEEGRRRKA
jgi:hypothetical protein